jgi:hypothetical protein
MRHDDPRLGPYSGDGQQIRAAVQLASAVEGLRLVLASTVGERYRVRVADDGRRSDCGDSGDGPQGQRH